MPGWVDGAGTRSRYLVALSGSSAASNSFTWPSSAGAPPCDSITHAGFGASATGRVSGRVDGCVAATVVGWVDGAVVATVGSSPPAGAVDGRVVGPAGAVAGAATLAL